jgi:hypothetical protein
MKKNKRSSGTEKRFEEECPPVWRNSHPQNPTAANLVKKFTLMEPQSTFTFPQKHATKIQKKSI